MPISPQDFFGTLKNCDIDFFVGVPDSLLKPLCFCIDANVSKNQHFIAANEGNAIALAAGYHLGTGKMALVYMQNSGIGNAINPLLSLCDPEVYSIPMLLIIGWRGEPGINDEYQHIKQGKVQLDLLKAIDLPYEIISKDDNYYANKVTKLIDQSNTEKRPVAILVKLNTFEHYEPSPKSLNGDLMTREDALEIILRELNNNYIYVSTTGKTSREIYEIRERNNETHNNDFLTVGSMGHCSSIALGIAVSKPNKTIICIDGDGALIMHMGSLSTIGNARPKNYLHILINNYVHESVGGQRTSANSIDMPSLASSNSYINVSSVREQNDLVFQLNKLKTCAGPNFLEIVVKAGSRKNLGRPTVKPIENKNLFMKLLSGSL